MDHSKLGEQVKTALVAHSYNLFDMGKKVYLLENYISNVLTNLGVINIQSSCT